MELQRHASILLRLSKELLQLAGSYDTGKGSDQVRANMLANMDEMRKQIEEIETRLIGEIETRLSAQAQKDRAALRAHFEVTLWETADSPTPFATIPVNAKMPLGALVFAMNGAHIKKAGYARVRFDGGQAEYYHVRIDRTQLHYDRAVGVPETEGEVTDGRDT
jgi:hypothetical protein